MSWFGINQTLRDFDYGFNQEEKNSFIEELTANLILRGFELCPTNCNLDYSGTRVFERERSAHMNSFIFTVKRI